MLIYLPSKKEFTDLTWQRFIEKMDEGFILLTPTQWITLLTRNLQDETKNNRLAELYDLASYIAFTEDGFVAFTTMTTVVDVMKDWIYVANTWIATHTGSKKVLMTLDLVATTMSEQIANTIHWFLIGSIQDVTGINPINFTQTFTNTNRINLLFVDNTTVEIPIPNEAAGLLAFDFVPYNKSDSVEGKALDTIKPFTGQIVFLDDTVKVDWDTITVVPNPTYI